MRLQYSRNKASFRCVERVLWNLRRPHEASSLQWWRRLHAQDLL